MLGLDLGVVEQHLRLFSGVSELANYEDYFDRISTIMAGIEARAVRAQAEAERAENALRSSMLTLAEAYGLEVSAAQREALADADLTALEALQRSLKTRRAWSL